MTIGYTIRSIRSQKGKPIKAVAAAANLSAKVLTDIEQEKRPISDGAIIFDICKALGVSVAEAFSDESLECGSRREARKILRPYLWQLAKERGQRLRMRREYIGYDIPDVAELTGYTLSFINDTERGNTIGMPYDVVQSFAKIYCCTPGWLLGNEDVGSFGSVLTNQKLLAAYQPFMVYPAHIAELAEGAGLSERQVAHNLHIPVSELRIYSKLSRVELSEESFRSLLQLLKTGPKELRKAPTKKFYTKQTEKNATTSGFDNDICTKILSTIEDGAITESQFRKTFNLNNQQWEMLKNKQLRFSSAVIPAIEKMLSVQFV